MSTSPDAHARVLRRPEPSDGAAPLARPLERPRLSALAPPAPPGPPTPPTPPTRTISERGTEKRRVLVGHLHEALTTGDLATADTIMRLLVAQGGVHAAHRALAASLAEHQEAGDPARAAVGRIAFSTARTVLEGMRTELAPPATAPLVLLVTPEGDRHTMALLTLSLELEGEGFRTMVLDDVPPEVVGAVVTTTAATAVVVSAHVRLSSKRARELVGAIRQARPGTVVAMGGPGVSPALRAADVVTEDPRELRRFLTTRDTVLTDREREVLLMVADGLTNSEIAERLCLSPATVKTHLDHIFAKTSTVHRAAAVANAFRHGWIT